MTKELVIVHVVGGIVDTVRLVRRAEGKTDEELLDAAIEDAQEIVTKGTATFDSETDDCRIFAVDEQGDSHEVWSYGASTEEE